MNQYLTYIIFFYTCTLLSSNNTQIAPSQEQLNPTSYKKLVKEMHESRKSIKKLEKLEKINILLEKHAYLLNIEVLLYQQQIKRLETIQELDNDRRFSIADDLADLLLFECEQDEETKRYPIEQDENKSFNEICSNFKDFLHQNKIWNCSSYLKDCKKY